MEMLDPFDAPQPGESLTSSPDKRYPFEQPPKMVDEQEAVEELFLRLTDEEVLDDILDVMIQGMPVEDITQVILFEGFRTGFYTPDLYLLLIEPCIYMLLALAEHAGIQPILYPEDDMDSDPEEGGVRALSNINTLLERKKLGDTEGSLETVSVKQSEDAIEAGGRRFERPESITPSMLDTIRSKMESN